LKHSKGRNIAAAKETICPAASGYHRIAMFSPLLLIAALAAAGSAPAAGVSAPTLPTPCADLFGSDRSFRNAGIRFFGSCSRLQVADGPWSRQESRREDRASPATSV
jgi:hypothetical protein